MTEVVIIYGGELAHDVAEQIKSKKPASVEVKLQNASERPSKKMMEDPSTIFCFVMQTIENAAPTEEGGTTVRFFKRKTHPPDLLAGGTQFAVLGLGDSNLLLDRQTTTAKDCNQVAQELDARLEALGGTRKYELGMADERSGLEEVEPWIQGFWKTFE